MRAQPNREEDKKLLQRLSEALNTSEERIHLDECGDWNIVGKRGHIFTDAELWHVSVEGTTKRRWDNIKKKLSFMEVSQDGDDEGIMKLERMPTQEESSLVRETVGLNKRPLLTDAQRAKLSERVLKVRKEGV